MAPFASLLSRADGCCFGVESDIREMVVLALYTAGYLSISSTLYIEEIKPAVYYKRILR